VYSGVNAGASFNRAGRAVDFNASGGSNLRYYPQLHSVAALGDQGAVGLAVHGRRTRFSVSQTIGYSPYYMLAPFAAPAQLEPGDVAPRAIDAAVYRRQAVTYGTDVRLDRSVGRRSDVRLNYDYTSASYTGELLQSRSEGLGGLYRYHVTSGTAIRLGYEHQQTTFATLGPRTVTHNLDVGVEYNKPLSLTRRTTLGISTGSAIVEQTGMRLYRALGDASLNHEMGRTWNARVNYHRGVGVIQGLASPIFADSATASVQGSITRRLESRTVASYTNGELGLTGRTNAFASYTGSSRLRFAFSRVLAVYGEYVVYRYQFANLASLPLGFPPKIDRQGIRAGLTLWLPLYQ
jgi:hypothetical protein